MVSHEEWEAVRLTLRVAFVAVVGSLPFGVLVAYVLARWQFPGKICLETLVNLPLVVPPVVTGYLLLTAFGRRGIFGEWLHDWFGVRLVFDWKGAALAAAVMAFPLLVRAARLSFAAVDPRLILAARTLGASRWDAFWSVSIPLARTGILSGAVLAFARCLGEFGATIMLAGNIPGETRTISLLLYSWLESPGGFERGQRLVWISVALAAAALFVSEYLERRSVRRTAAG